MNLYPFDIITFITITTDLMTVAFITITMDLMTVVFITTTDLD